MSTLWTPSGERPIRRSPEAPASEPAETQPSSGQQAPPSDAELREKMAELQAELARTPAEVVVANHAFGLFELAALHLSQQPPQLPQARLAIDALAALVEGLSGRLGDAEKQLADGLGQLRLAFVQISAAPRPPAD